MKDLLPPGATSAVSVATDQQPTVSNGHFVEECAYVSWSARMARSSRAVYQIE